MANIFEWEKDLISKNVHSVFTYCKNCKLFGVNLPLNTKCGNCSCADTITYYDSETIDRYLKK